MANPVATIDIGTNTTLLLVARPPSVPGGHVEVLENAAEITRLGRGIGSTPAPSGTGGPRLGQAGIDATLEALRRFAERAKHHGAEIFAVGTEALRRAENAADFTVAARAILGRDIEIIAGEREAELTFRAVAASFPEPISKTRGWVIDIGGGSTEIIETHLGQAVSRKSLPLGSVRLTERHIRHDPATPEEIAAIRNDVVRAIEQAGILPDASAAISDPRPCLIGVAGTVTTLAAMALSLNSYDPERVHGSTLTLAELELHLGRLAGADQAARESMIGLDPKRADVIFAGGIILHEIAKRAGVDRILVSDRGIRWGLFFEHTNDNSPT